jgi:hypothetical protein
MKIQNYRIKLYYKLNKLKKGKWGKPDKYIHFFGSEIPSFKSGPQPNPLERKIYEGDLVIFKHPEKPNHPNNGLKALVNKVHKPAKIADKIKAWEERKKGPYPLEEKRYDLTFILEDEDKEERRMSFAEGNRREIIKMSMEYVERRKILAVPEKKLLLSINSGRINSMNNSDKTKLIGRKVKNLMDTVFKKGLDFKPKYVDKTSKNYETWNARQKAEGFFYDPNKEKIIERGDFITSVPRTEDKSKKTYKKPTEKYKLKNFTIEKIDASKALKDIGKSYFYDDVDREFYAGEGLIPGDRLIEKTRLKLYEITGNNKTRTSDSFFRAQLERNNFLKNPSMQKSWSKFLARFMVEDVLKRKDKTDTEVIQSWSSITHGKGKGVFSFLYNKSFLKKPLREQLYIVRKIIGKTKTSLLGEFMEAGRHKAQTDTAKKEEYKQKFKDISLIPFVRGNIPKVNVYVKFYIEGESDLGQRFGFGPRCEQAVDELKTALNSIIGISAKKSNRRTRKRKNRAPDFSIGKVAISTGGTRRRRKVKRTSTRKRN